MHTPVKAQMQIVIDNLKKVLPRAMHEGALDMTEGAVNNRKGHTCGTTHCFAGWYAVAVLDNSQRLSYEDGKYMIEEHLGFCEVYERFKVWADHRSDLWGNMAGIGVLSNKTAFYHPDKRPEGAENLQHIIDHLEEVRDRLPV